ncbi:MAG: hypothetical protein ABTQ34_09470 [Bdellovibrionales bacterium]
MVDIPTATTALTGTASPRASAGQSVASIDVTLLQAPNKISAATRVIEATGLLASAPNASRITLATALGTLELALTELLGQREQRQILDLLTNLYQRRAAVTLMIAPGTPQAKFAQLLLPERQAQAPISTPSSQPRENMPLHLLLKQTLETNPISSQPAIATTLRAIVLPAATESPWPAASTNAQPLLAQPPSANPAHNAATAYQTYDNAVRNALNALQEVQNAAQQTAPTTWPHQQTAGPIPPPTPPPQSLQPPTPLTPSLTTGQEVFLRVAPANAPPSVAPSATAKTTELLTQPTPVSSNVWQDIATVEAKGPDGQAVLKSSSTSFFVAANASPLAKASIGSQWSIVLAQQPLPEPIDSSSDAVQPNPDSLPGLLNALAEYAPANKPELAFLRPQLATDHQLGASLLFLLSALKGKDWQSWQGETAPHNLILHAAQTRLIDKLKETLRKTSHEEESANGDLWRPYTLPLSEQNMTSSISGYPVLYVRKDGHENSADQNDPHNLETHNTRFLIDMNLSKLGAIQLDGLVGNKKMDLILRSEKPLPESMLAELKPLYEQTLSAFGYAGLLLFQTDRSRWIVFKKTQTQPPVIT